MTLPFGPPVPGFGPRPNRIAIVGGYPGDSETNSLRPFVGAAGWELRKELDAIGVRLDDCFRTNVFSRQPPEPDAAAFGTVGAAGGMSIVRAGAAALGRNSVQLRPQ